MPTICNRGFYCRPYCLLNIFRAPLCPSSGAQECYTVVAACGISCCGFLVAGLVWSWGLCVQFAGCWFTGSVLWRVWCGWLKAPCYMPLQEQYGEECLPRRRDTLPHTVVGVSLRRRHSSPYCCWSLWWISADGTFPPTRNLITMRCSTLRGTFCSLITLATARQEWTGSNPSGREGGGCGFTLSRSDSCCAVRLVYIQISPCHIWTTLYIVNFSKALCRRTSLVELQPLKDEPINNLMNVIIFIQKNLFKWIP